MTATNHGDQLGEIYPTMFNGRNCTFGVSFLRFRYCGGGRHGNGIGLCEHYTEDTSSHRTIKGCCSQRVLL